MNREKAINYLRSSGFSEEQITAIKQAFNGEPCDDAISRTRLKEVFHRNVVCGEAYDELIDAQPPVMVQENKEDIHNEREQAYMKGYEDASKRYRTEPCEDAISRTAVLNTLDSMDKALDENRAIEEYKELLRECYEQLPPVSVAEKVGEWIDREVYDADRWKCSECGRTEPYKENYCPNCGARMIEPQESDGR